MPKATSRSEYKPDVPTLYLALELGRAQWKLGFSTRLGERPRLRTIAGGNLLELASEIAAAKKFFGLSRDCRVLSCYEAGRDGFWLHRALVEAGVESLVVDSSSIEVNRRQRKAKTDALDARKLLDLLMRFDLGSRHVWSVVRVPTLEQEDARHLHRELRTLKTDQTRLRNRIRGLLFGQGIRVGAISGRLDLDRLRCWDGKPLLAGLRRRLVAELEHLTSIHRRILDLEVARRAALATSSERSLAQTAKLMRLRGLGPNASWLFAHELFGWRELRNRRQVGGLAGLVPTPHASGDSTRERGISKAGIRSVRHMAIEIAWRWTHFQPRSALTRWYQQRFGKGGPRLRRIGIVALARKLLVALWRYLEFDEVPQGAKLKPA